MTTSKDYNSIEPKIYQISDNLVGKRLDAALSALIPEYSRVLLQKLIEKEQVCINGTVCDKKQRKLLLNEEVSVNLALLSTINRAGSVCTPEDIPLEIIYEDQSIAVINKPAGLVTHLGAGNWSGTLQNGLIYHYPQLQSVPRAGIVHRLDKDTSGLLVIAKTVSAQTSLVRQLQARTVSRKYLAIVHGTVAKEGTVESLIARDRKNRLKMIAIENTQNSIDLDYEYEEEEQEENNSRGKAALTYFRLIEKYSFPPASCSLIECTLATGRTHQIRVHMSSIKHPLIGDQLYGKTNHFLPKFPRQALHAFHLEIDHPKSSKTLAWQAAIPDDMLQLLEVCRHNLVK